MAFFPQQFRLTARSRRIYQFQAEGGGGQGPPGPPGQGVVDLDNNMVNQGIKYLPLDFFVFKFVMPIDGGGPNNNQLTIPITPIITNGDTYLRVSGALMDPINFFIVPLPHVADPNAAAPMNASISCWHDGTNIYLSSLGDYSAFTKGFVVLDYIDPDSL